MTTGNFQEYMDLRQQAAECRGGQVCKSIAGILASVRLFSRNKEVLIAAIRGHAEVLEANPRSQDPETQQISNDAMDEICRLLHNFLAAAFSLVDHVRIHRRFLYSENDFDQEIQSSLEARITSLPEHLMSQGLRNSVLHHQLPDMRTCWHLDPGTPIRVTFSIPILDLLSSGYEWKGREKRALQNLGEELVIEEYVERYFEQIKGFYDWLWERQEDIHKADMEEYDSLLERAKQMEPDFD